MKEIPTTSMLSKLEASFISALPNAPNPSNGKPLTNADRKLEFTEAQVAASWIHSCHPQAASAANMKTGLKDILTKQPAHPIRPRVINYPHQLLDESQCLQKPSTSPPNIDY